MTWTRLLRSELRKLSSTKMPWAFLGVLVVIAAINASAVIWGTDFDGSKTFVSTAEDQRSLIAFAANAMLGAALFGAIGVAREYGHGTVIPTYLSSPRRHRAVLAQLAAVALGGALLSLVGAALTAAAVAVALPTTEFGFLVSAGGVGRVLAASAFAGAVGAVLGAGLGMIVRNTGGAVTGVVLLLFIAPPLIVQLVNDAATWIPSPLATALAGVTSEAAGVGSQASTLGAMLGLLAWAAVPALIGLVAVQRRERCLTHTREIRGRIATLSEPALGEPGRFAGGLGLGLAIVALLVARSQPFVAGSPRSWPPRRRPYRWMVHRWVLADRGLPKPSSR